MGFIKEGLDSYTDSRFDNGQYADVGRRSFRQDPEVQARAAEYTRKCGEERAAAIAEGQQKKIGDTFAITGGAFAGFTGTIVSLDPLQVEVEVLGKKHTAKV